MGRRPNLSRIEKMLQAGENFSLTDAQYTKSSGIPLPKEMKYLIGSSALARMCQKYGFHIRLQEKTVFIEK